jgi:DNA-binding beta-propeller fold protein YncE
LGEVSFPITLDIKTLPGAESLPPVELQPRGLAISNDGNFLACALSNLATVIVVDISLVNNLPALIANNDLDCTNNFSISIVNLELTDRPTRLAFSPTGKYILTSNYNTHSVSVINNEGENAVLIGTVDLSAYGRNPQEIDFTIDNATGHEFAYTVLSLPATGSGNGKVVYFDLDAYAADAGTPPAITEIAAGNMPVGIAMDTDYKFAVVSNFGDDNSVVINLSTDAVLPDKIASPGGPTTVERYNAENIFYVANRLDGSITLFKLKEDGKPGKIRTLSGLSQPGSIAIQQNP